MGQPGFFDLERRLDALSAKGDPLETIKTTVPWEAFRADIEAATGKKAHPKKAARCPVMPETMVRSELQAPQPTLRTQDRTVAVPEGAFEASNTVARQAIMPMGRGTRLAYVKQIRSTAALPETADEVCIAARAAGANNDDIYLGERATETAIKALSDNGTLAHYKVVHFATHGALTGELKGSSEPGLILSPPDTATANNDGYLSASEIAGLKLDADWVILSACNTAGGEANSAEALSGLARAFFYAGARSLLVSHWYVDSQATVALITQAFEAQKRNPEIGRAGALRHAMLSLISSGERTWQPAYWAPFVLVGEGG